jgi:MoaA/NifB/PqqE/SkfB family radical SAM enzyme
MKHELSQLKESKTFCVFPFVHLATLTDGSVTPCCIASATDVNLNQVHMQEAWNSEQLKQIRLDMMNGKHVKNCQQCYRDEASGINSHRTSSNEYFIKMYSEQVQTAVDGMETDGALNVDPVTLDIRAGNTCNLKCIMCRPNESSKWVSDAKKLATISIVPEVQHDWSWKQNINTQHYTWVEKPDFWSEFETLVPNLQEIIFGGGEPFLSKSINNLIEYMVKTGHSKHIKIRFHTNGTQIPETFWPLVDSFREIELMFSIDGLADQNYYVRYPADWAEVEKNLWLADQTKAKSMFLTSLHALNVHDLVDLYRWRLEQSFKRINDIPIVFGRVYHPSYLNPQRLPANVKSEVKRKIEEFLAEYHGKRPAWYFEALVSNLNWIMEDAPGGSDALVEYIKNLDTLRGTNFQETFPQLSKLL